MNIEDLREYCLSKPGTTEGFPFNDTALVFKVADKMYALLDLSEGNKGISLKCEPELALSLREMYPAVTPGYHFNKKHWNTVKIDGSVPSSKIIEWINHSYQLVVSGLPRNKREVLKL